MKRLAGEDGAAATGPGQHGSDTLDIAHETYR